MRRIAIAALQYKNIAISIVLGALFVYAGALKIRTPLVLADTMAAFGILPVALIIPFALALSPFEIIAGLLLLVGWHRRVGALALLIAVALYTTAIGSALARGIVIDCGCFGGGGPATRGQMWLDLGRDLTILLAASAVYVWSMPSSTAVPPETRS